MPHFHPLDLQLTNFRALFLFVFALVNYVLMYAVNILLARALPIDEFDDYNVALSLVTILSTIATLGLEKYALRAIALFKDRHDWRRLRGFWTFSIRCIIGFSIVLILLLALCLEIILRLKQAEYHPCIIVFAAFLPVISLSLFLVEVIAAQGAYFKGMALYRILLPILYGLFLLGIDASPHQLSAVIAVICFGCAWIITCIILWRVSKTLLAIEFNGLEKHYRPHHWLKHSLPLVLNSLLMTFMTNSGVIILEILFPSSIDVGIYAVAAQTGGFISLLGTSTNRYYLPKMALLIEHQDSVAITSLMQQRALALGSIILTLFIAIAVLGKTILTFFGTHFGAGYHTLIVIAAGAAISALFADVPYYLQFMGLHKIVLSLTLAAVLSMLILSVSLGSQIGALGVAIAYMITVTVLFITLRIIADKRFHALHR